MYDLRPTYEFFTKEYGGTIQPEEFSDGLAGAESFVKYLVGWNPVDTEEKATAYKRAVCACVEAFALYGDGALGGFHIGNFSATQTAYTGSANARDVANQKAKGELLSVGLLWGGIA